MSAAAPEDLDALLASLLGPAPASEPEPVAEVAPVVAALLLPELPADAEAAQAALRAWLDAGAPGGTWQAPELGPPVVVAEPLEPEILFELAAARAWRAGDQGAFDKALARLPTDRAEHHRRMASVCEMIRMRQEARARLKGEVRAEHPPPPPLAPPDQ